MSNSVRVPVLVTRSLHTHVTLELDDVEFDKFITDGILNVTEDELEDLLYTQCEEEDFFEESFIFELDNAYEH